RTLAVPAGDDPRAIQLRDAGAGEVRGVCRLADLPERGIQFVALAPDGRTLAVTLSSVRRYESVTMGGWADRLLRRLGWNQMQRVVQLFDPATGREFGRLGKFPG